jgi:hypothetical protein
MWKLHFLFIFINKVYLISFIYELNFLSVMLIKFLLFVLSTITRKKKDLIKDFFLF